MPLEEAKSLTSSSTQIESAQELTRSFLEIAKSSSKIMELNDYQEGVHFAANNFVSKDVINQDPEEAPGDRGKCI